MSTPVANNVGTANQLKGSYSHDPYAAHGSLSVELSVELPFSFLRSKPASEVEELLEVRVNHFSSEGFFPQRAASSLGASLYITHSTSQVDDQSTFPQQRTYHQIPQLPGSKKRGGRRNPHNH
jgi:hypothetical protein